MDQNVNWERYDEVLHLVYAAAIDPDLWPEALKQIADLWQVSKAILFSFSVPDGKVIFNIGHNISARGLLTYATRTANKDPFVEAAYRLGLASEGNVTIGETHVSREEVMKTDFYREVWEPENIGQTCYAVIFDGTDSKKAPVVLSLMRSLDEPTFVEFDRQMLKRMLTHLSRAMGVMFHLRDLEFKIAATKSALDALSAGVVLLDADQTIAFENQSVSKLLAHEDPLRYEVMERHGQSGRRLKLAHKYQALYPKFEAMLRQASLSHMRDEIEHFSEALIVEDSRTGQPKCVIHAAPLVIPNSAHALPTTPVAIVFVYELKSIELAPERLESLFGLTRAEARAALEMLQGGTAIEIASRLGVSFNTFKTHLKSVYEKTYTHRQADLLKLLTALAS